MRRTFTGPRPWETIEETPYSELPEISRGELRLAAEVARAQLRGEHVPTFAHERAVTILEVMARA
jgi:hypothetical protein